jgi:hypothetical protein
VLGVLLALFRARRDLVLENAALRHHLAVALRTNPKPRLRQRDRMLWVWLSRLWPEGWRRHLALVQPAIVISWHRKGGGCIGFGDHALDSAGRASASR